MKCLNCEWKDVTSGHILRRKVDKYKIYKARIDWLVLIIEFNKPCYPDDYVFTCKALGVENFVLNTIGLATAKSKAGAKCQSQLKKMKEMLEYKFR